MDGLRLFIPNNYCSEPPLAHVEMAGTGQKKVAGAGWLRAPPRWGMKEVNLAH